MIKAIVIDDERASFSVIEYLLNSLCMPIKLAGFFNSGENGWNAIETMNPDIVFLDIQMPGMNGIDIMNRIKNKYKGEIKVIIVTAYDYFEYAQAAIRLGAKDILLKPIDQKQFADAIENALGYHFTDNELFNSMVEYVNSNYSGEIILKECAKDFHTSPQQISRLFKKYLNKSFISYVNEIRINEAKNLLRSSKFSIKEVAFKIGYNNLNHFYKNFNKQVGMTPKEYMMEKGKL